MRIHHKNISNSQRRVALFLDRDGVINKDTGYLHKPRDVVFSDGIFSLCSVAKQLNMSLIVVTNQAGIARGFYSEQDFIALSRWFHDAFRVRGMELVSTYYCPHHPDFGRKCICRKPASGLFKDAERELNIDLTTSVMIGDKSSDMQAAADAGVGLRILYSNDLAQEPFGATRVFELDEAEKLLRATGVAPSNRTSGLT